VTGALDAEETVARHAAWYGRRLRETIMPYWARVAPDDECGGYHLAGDPVPDPARASLRARLRRRDGAPTDTKLAVTHARLLWLFSHAHRARLGSSAEYLVLATRGYDFLVEHFHDVEHGGYRWSTDRRGEPVNATKNLYAQAFVIYALVEYAAVAGGEVALQHASDVYSVTDRELHDDVHGGWRDHGDVDWSPMAAGDPRYGWNVIGRKSGDAHLHWMEALTELYAATADEAVRRSLVEVLDVLACAPFPDDPAQGCAYLHPDLGPDAAIANPSRYGHNLEYAWLRVRADRAVGREPSWSRFEHYLDDTVHHGFDREHGGFYTTDPASAAFSTDKDWWVQAEAVAALTDGLVHRWDDTRAVALARTLEFVERHQLDPTDGVWRSAVGQAGGRRDPRKSHAWKAGYHEVRALRKLVDAFG
jgi:mannobiose 2-epimerase